MIDFLLLLMVVIWGTNYSIVKAALAEIDAQAFNALRMLIASGVFLAIMTAMRVWPVRRPGSGGGDGFASVFQTDARVTGAEWWRLIGLGLVGHCLYQYFFMGGLSRTSVSNSALMIGMTPVIVAILSAVLRIEPVGAMHWLGAGLSLTGLYLVVGQGFSLGSHGAVGDLMMFLAVCCWAIYTIGARPLMIRHSPVGVTGMSMMIGTAIYVPVTLPNLRTVHWSAVSASTWGWLVYSALFSLCVAYTIWYAGIRQIGTARTSVYSNLVPVVAMVTAIVFLHEPIALRKVLGAAAVIAGVALTRIRGVAPPPQE